MPPPPPPLTVWTQLPPLPLSPTDSRLLPTLPQQLIHCISTPMAPCTRHRRAGWQRVAYTQEMDKVFIEKRRQLSAGKKDNYWALAKCKKGYSAIDREIRSLFVAAFNNNLHVRQCEGVGLQGVDADWSWLGNIISDIVCDISTIKGKAGVRQSTRLLQADE